MPFKNISFKPYIKNDRRQLEVNKSCDYESYAGTCVYAQQTAEKVLKQKLLDFGAGNTKTHNLKQLANNLAFLADYNLNGRGTHDLRDAVKELSQLYIPCRYPVNNKEDLEVTKELAVRSVEQCELIVKWVGSIEIEQDSEELKERLMVLEEKEERKEKLFKSKSRHRTKIGNAAETTQTPSKPLPSTVRLHPSQHPFSPCSPI